MASDRTTYVQQCLIRLRQGEPSARDELITAAGDRLVELTRAMLRDYHRLRRWEETDDVLQNALLRLHRALQSVVPETSRDFYRLATLQIRRELIDLSRHYFGPAGHGRHGDGHAPGDAARTDGPGSREVAESTLDPGKLGVWTDFHRQVERLPDEEREVFELVWYQDLKQTEAADLLGVAPRTVMRRWHRACLKLHEAMQGIMPGAAGTGND
jgi:RNA polymerase sigma-70 factor (ECF subfamily)